MTLQASGISYWPPLQMGGNYQANALAIIGMTFDSTADRLAWVGMAYQTDSIAAIHVRTSTVPTGDTVEVRIESVTNGRPSGSLLAANTNALVVIADTDDNVWKTATLTAAASVTPGLEFAIVIVHSAESGGAGINISFGGTPIVFDNNSGHYPLKLHDTGGGTYAAQTTAGAFEWIVQMTSAGVVFFPGLSPLNGGGTITAFNTGTSPNERAAKLVPPFACHVLGLRIAMFNVAAGADFTGSLWDSTDNPGSGPTPLGQSALDGDFPISTTQDGYVDMFFTNGGTDIAAGATVYAGLRPDTANSVGLAELTTATVSNAIRAFGLGSNTAHLSTRVWTGTDPGAWTDTTTTFPLIHLIIDKYGDDVGGGGGGGQRVIGG